MDIALLKKVRLEARKAKNKIGSDVLATLIGELEYEQEKGKVIDASVIVPKVKKYIETAESNADKSPTVNGTTKFLEESDFLEDFLIEYAPKQLDEKQMEEVILAGAFKNIGEVMRYFKEFYAGQYNGKTLSKLAKGLLA